MKTNDIKKGMRIQMRNGWFGTMCDNAKGNIRMCEIEGFEKEIGSVYSHDIESVCKGKDTWYNWELVEHTPEQIKMRQMVERELLSQW